MPINSNGSSLRVEHNLNGETVSEDELRKLRYAHNQQQEPRQKRQPGDPAPFLRKPDGEPIPDRVESEHTKRATEDPALTKANNKDLKNKRLK